MRFQNNVTDKKVAEAIKIADALLLGQNKLHEELKQKHDWKYDQIKDGYEVAFQLFKLRAPIQVFTYKPLNPWTSAIGYFDGKAIHINIRKLPGMTVKSIVGNLLHEYSHYCGFTHGNNYKTKEKCLYSVPYFISENVHRWIQ